MNRRLIFVFAAIALVTSCGVQSETTSDNGPEESTTTTERPPERDRTSSTSTSIDVSSPFDEVLRSYAPDRAEASTVIPTYEASTSTPEEEMLTFSQFVVGNLDEIWTSFFSSQNLAEPYVTVQYVSTGMEFDTGCTDAQGNPLVVNASTPNAFYCPVGPTSDAVDPIAVNYTHPNGSLVLPLQTLLSIRDRGVVGERASVVPGDFAVALILAHEFGHHVADELASQLSVALPAGKNIELIADCLAGVWAYTAYYNNLLEAGDWEEGIALLSVLGDEDILTQDSHGTAEERIAAFETGYNTGDILACSNAYWPA